jgi:hypothetical protein
MVVGLDCTYNPLHASYGQRFRLDAHPDRSRSAWSRRGQTPGMTAAVPHGARRRAGLPHAHEPKAESASRV